MFLYYELQYTFFHCSVYVQIRSFVSKIKELLDFLKVTILYWQVNWNNCFVLKFHQIWTLFLFWCPDVILVLDVGNILHPHKCSNYYKLLPNVLEHGWNWPNVLKHGCHSQNSTYLGHPFFHGYHNCPLWTLKFVALWFFQSFDWLIDSSWYFSSFCPSPPIGKPP